MFVAHWVFVALGLWAIWVGLKTTEEVYRIAWMSTGAIAFAWGFAIAPTELQMLVEILFLAKLLRGRFSQQG